MAFYGRLTNESKTSMTFDRVYPNRVTMDAMAESDGVFSGRFVLVEYDSPIDGLGVFDPTSENIYIASVEQPLVIYKLLKSEEGEIISYEQISQEKLNKLSYGTGFIVHLYNNFEEKIEFAVNENNYKPNTYYIQIENEGKIEFQLDNSANFDAEKTYYVSGILDENWREANKADQSEIYLLVLKDSGNISKLFDVSSYLDLEAGSLQFKDIYSLNYNIDKAKYPRLGRGYDATVWRKVITADKEEKLYSRYVMLAELNSVVPTFDITTVAPSPEGEAPFKPKFGKDSSNVYYDLQIAANWGFKVNEPEFNIKGFNKELHHNDLENPAINEIKFTEIASGAKYTEIDPETKEETAGAESNDIQRLDINLPAIGYMVSEGWDRIYGVGKNNENIDAPKTRETNIIWHDGHEIDDPDQKDLYGPNGNRINDPSGLIVKEGIYKPGGVEAKDKTIYNTADAIRSTFDIMGMIIEPISLEQYINVDVPRPTSASSPGYIYYVDAKDEEINASNLSEEEKQQLKKTKFYYLDKKYGFTEDNITESSQLVNGKKAIEVNASVINFEDNTYRFNGIKNAPHYTLSNNHEASANITYYTLDTSIFDNKKIDTSAVEHNFITAVSNGQLFTATTASSDDGSNYITLTKVPTSVTSPEANVKYYYVESNTHIGGNIVDGEDIGIPFFTPTYGNMSGYLFYDENAREITLARFAEMDVNTTIYTRESQEPQIDEDGNITYITVLTERIKKGQFSGRNEAEKIYQWPTNDFTWDEEAEFPIDSNTLSNCYWIELTDNNGNITGYRLSNKRPDITQPIFGEEAAINSILGTGNLPVKNYSTVRLATIPSIKLIEEFYKPSTYYWGMNKNEKNDITDVYFKTLETNDNVNNTYKLDTSLQETTNLLVLKAISGIDGDQDYSQENSETQYYFVPNELYTFDENTGSYILEKKWKDEWDTNLPQFFTAQNASVKIDRTGQFNVGEPWNFNLNLSQINADPARQQLIWADVYDENEVYYNASGEIIDISNEYTNGNDLPTQTYKIQVGPVVIGYKTSTLSLLPLDGYAYDLNTINGIIVAMNKKLGADDPNSRDTSTVQGILNALQDKLEKLDDTPGNSLVVTDKYGHLDSVVKVGPESETANVYEFSTKTSTEGYDAFITQPMTGATLVDGTVIPDFVADTNTDGSNNNSWITADIKTNSDGQAFGYILHNLSPEGAGTTSTVSETDLNTPTPTDIITLKDIIWDDAGHIVDTHDHIYTLPYGFKSFTAGSVTVVADSTQDTITFSGDSWINVAGDATNDKVTFTHTATGSLSAGDTTARMPSFGGTFNTLAVGTDEAGHVSTLSAYSVTIPSISFDGAGSSSVSGDGTNVMTGLAFDNATGQLTATYTTVGTLSSVATSTTTDMSAITNSDSLADALKKLQNRIDSVISSIDGLDRTLTCSDVPGLSFTITQEDGALSTFSGDVDWVTISDAIATTTLSTAPLNTTAQTIQGAINELQNAINSSAFSPADYARIFRIPSAPQNDNTDYTTVNGVYGTSFDATTNPFLSGWMWIDTSTNYIYFYTGTAWELLNSWR